MVVIVVIFVPHSSIPYQPKVGKRFWAGLRGSGDRLWGLRALEVQGKFRRSFGSLWFRAFGAFRVEA